MALLRRKANGDDMGVETERTGTSPGLLRALATLLGVAVAGLLVWLAREIADGGLTEAANGDFWIAVALIAGAGLALGLSQLFGGWTKWGWPTLSPTVFLLGFLPTLVVGGWILLAKQPQEGTQEGRVDGWSSDLGIDGLVNDLATFLPVIPLIIGLVLAFSFDTTGPRTQRIRREPAVPDEDVHDYRRERETTMVATPPASTEDTTRTSTGSTVAEELRHRDERPETVTTGSRIDRDDSDRGRTV